MRSGFFFGSLLDLSMPLPGGGCTVPVLEVEGRCTICLSRPGGGRDAHIPPPHWDRRVSHACRSIQAHNLLLGTRPQGCPDHHISNSWFGNWVGFRLCRSDLTSSALCSLVAGAGESALWMCPAGCCGWLDSGLVPAASLHPAESWVFAHLLLRTRVSQGSCWSGLLGGKLAAVLVPAHREDSAGGFPWSPPLPCEPQLTFQQWAKILSESMICR